jgi:hypothetical protein
VSVAYDPSANTALADAISGEADEVRALRGIAAAASRDGVFHLTGETGESLAIRMQTMKFIDPALGVYAAYAYHDAHDTERLKSMDGYMRRFYGTTLFDLALLARTLEPAETAPPYTMVGFAPLLSQGWAYLRGRRVLLPPGLERLPTALKDSLWTLFAHEGVGLLRKRIFKGKPI